MKKVIELLSTCGGLNGFKLYVKHNRPSDEVIDHLIFTKKNDYLLEVMKVHKLSCSQVTEILYREGVDSLMVFTVRQNTLNQEQQEILVEKNNPVLLESYFCPDGFFLTNRRLSSIAEYTFIYNMVKEWRDDIKAVFKTYVDHCCRQMMTLDLIDMLIAGGNSKAMRYIFRRAKVKKEWEEMFVQKAPDYVLKIYIDSNTLATPAAQKLLIEKDIELAKQYFTKHGFYGDAYYLYNERRRDSDEQK